MMQTRDWVSGIIGVIVGIIGLSSFLTSLSFVQNFLSAPVLRWIVFLSGLYLAWNSILEITNSNIIGWWSFLGVALPAIVIGSLPFFGIGMFGSTFYSIVLVVVGLFLAIATFAMEL